VPGLPRGPVDRLGPRAALLGVRGVRDHVAGAMREPRCDIREHAHVVRLRERITTLEQRLAEATARAARLERELVALRESRDRAWAVAQWRGRRADGGPHA
jgi:hypothetical protein